MGTEILTRMLEPTLSLTTLQPVPFSSLFEIMPQFPEQNDVNNKDSFICETSHFPFNENASFQIYCILPRSNRRMDYDNYPAVVLQRRKVVSKVLEHSVENCNFEAEFKTLLQYIQEKQLKNLQNYRIVFHKEKRKWKRKSFLQKAKKMLITELQIEIES